MRLISALQHPMMIESCYVKAKNKHENYYVQTAYFQLLICKSSWSKKFDTFTLVIFVWNEKYNLLVICSYSDWTGNGWQWLRQLCLLPSPSPLTIAEVLEIVVEAHGYCNTTGSGNLYISIISRAQLKEEIILHKIRDPYECYVNQCAYSLLFHLKCQDNILITSSCI